MNRKIVIIGLLVNVFAWTSSQECTIPEPPREIDQRLREKIQESLPNLLEEGFQRASNILIAEEKGTSTGTQEPTPTKPQSDDQLQFSKRVSRSVRERGFTDGVRMKQSKFRKTSLPAKTESACRGLGILETAKVVVEKFDLRDMNTVDKINLLESIKLDPDQLPKVPNSELCQSEKTTLKPFPGLASTSCDPLYPYRLIDGSCNNLSTGKGRAITPFKRCINPDYDDGISTIRNAGLPNPRTVSADLHGLPLLDPTDGRITQMLKAWGQFLDHDVTHTPGSNAGGYSGTLGDIVCCDEGVYDDTTPAPPLMPRNRNCCPIDVRFDLFYQSHGVECLPFVRSLASTPFFTFLHPRQQMNDITAFIDGSGVYGSDDDTANSLRTFVGGKLKDSTPGEIFFCSGGSHCLNFLPPDADMEMFVAGDVRANEQPSLTSLHTVFLRYHNLLAEKFGTMSGYAGNDEKIYQETRRIIGALIQQITYTEFLPIVLGTSTMSSFDLNLGPTTYDPSIDPSIANVFAAAAYRFGHSLVADKIQGDVLIDLVETFFESKNLMTSSLYYPSKILRGELLLESERMDVHLSDTLTNKLFADGPAFTHGLDLMALNIKRGRDHGLPGYNAWRRKCELSTFCSFSALTSEMPSNVVSIFENHYSHPDEIDLFPAGLAEKPIPGGLLGPTFTCILAKQFQELKFGDRFWFENGGQPKPFTLKQLYAIKQTSLARILCETTTINYISRWPMRHPLVPGNHLRSCCESNWSVLRALPSYWRE